jgi:hypothetical protein
MLTKVKTHRKIGRATIKYDIHIQSGLGNLSSKNSLRDRFLAQNLDRQLDRDFQDRISDRKAEQVFKTETGLQTGIRQSF